MIPSYLAGTVYLFSIWVLCFLLNKKDRKEQLAFSFAGAMFGPLVQQMHLHDWWNPNFLYSSVIKVEDILFGFSVAGISAIIYETVFQTKQRNYKKLKVGNKYLAFVSALFVLAMFGLFWIGLSSFLSSLVATIIITVLILIRRQDLILPMLLSASLVTIIATPAYLVGLYINPDWIENEWYLQKLSGISIWEIPIEEFIWFYTVGLSASTLWELKEGTKFLKKKKQL